MKKLLLIGLIGLSGCASWDHYRYNKGYEDGKKYNRYGKADKTEYYSGFFKGFFTENLRGR